MCGLNVVVGYNFSLLSQNPFCLDCNIFPLDKQTLFHSDLFFWLILYLYIRIQCKTEKREKKI